MGMSKDKLFEMLNMLKEMKKEREEDVLIGGRLFPVSSLRNNTPEQQFSLIKTELKRLEKAIENKSREEIALESTNLMECLNTMLNIVEKKFSYYQKEVIFRNMEKGIYDEFVDKDEQEVMINAHKANKKMTEFFKNKEIIKEVENEDVPFEVKEINEKIEIFIKNYKGTKENFPKAFTEYVRSLGAEVLDFDEKSFSNGEYNMSGRIAIKRNKPTRIH